jgi:hypothetical protein
VLDLIGDTHDNKILESVDADWADYLKRTAGSDSELLFAV